LLGVIVRGNLFPLTDAALSFSQTGSEDYPVGVLTSRGRVNIEGRVQFTARAKFADPMVYSGNKIYVAEGETKLELVLGGSIKLCNKTQLAILHGHSPYLFTLDRGSVYFELPDSRGDTFFTPDFLIQTEIDHARQPSAFRGVITVETGGVVCVTSIHGGLKLTAQNNRDFMILPSGTSVRLSPGEVKPDSVISRGNCSCLSSPRESKSLIMSFQPQHRHRSLLARFFATLGHIITLGLA